MFYIRGAWIKPIIFTFLLINLVGLYILQTATSSGFENTSYYRLIFAAIAIWVWWMTFRIKRLEPLIIVTLYMAVNNLDKLYLGISFPLYVVALTVTVVTFLLYYATLKLSVPYKTHLFPIYSAVMGLACAEVYYAVSLWPTTHTTRSIIVAINFYLVWHLGLYHLKEKITKNVLARYAVYLIISLLLIIFSTSWYNL